MEKSKLVLLIMCLLTCLSCSKANNLQPSEDEDDQTELINNDSADNNIDAKWWFARLKLKPQADENYRATEDPQIKALLLKYGVKMTQCWRWPTSDSELLLYFDLAGKDDLSVANKENCLKDFLATGKIEVVYKSSITELDWTVRLKLKPQADKNYLATEDTEIMALVLKHGVRISQSWPDPKAPLELLLDYDLRGSGTMSEESKIHCIADFLATGKFEDEVYEYKRGQWI